MLSSINKAKLANRMKCMRPLRLPRGRTLLIPMVSKSNPIMMNKLYKVSKGNGRKAQLLPNTLARRLRVPRWKS
ncbi:hypothetical protein ACSQ67_014644 [Phaseolus vulgaris]